MCVWGWWWGGGVNGEKKEAESCFSAFITYVILWQFYVIYL